MEASVHKTVENLVETGGEIGVLKDALGLGVLLLIIASTQMASFMFGA
jgi:hypothetical protein